MFFQQEILTHFIQEHRRSHLHMKRKLFPSCLITKKRKQINSFISLAKKFLHIVGSEFPVSAGGPMIQIDWVVGS